jgi:WD40 repeat protein
MVKAYDLFEPGGEGNCYKENPPLVNSGKKRRSNLYDEEIGPASPVQRQKWSKSQIDYAPISAIEFSGLVGTDQLLQKSLGSDQLLAEVLDKDSEEGVLYIFTGHQNGEVYQFNLNLGERLTKRLLWDAKRRSPSEKTKLTLNPLRNHRKKYSQVHNTSISAIAVTHDKRFLFSGDCEGYIAQFSIKTSKPLKKLDRPHASPITHLLATPELAHLLTATETGLIQRLSLSQNFSTQIQTTSPKVTALTSSSDSEFLFVCNSQGNLKQYDISNPLIVNDYGIIHEYRVHCLL